MEGEKIQKSNFFAKEQGYKSAVVPFAFGLFNKDKKTRTQKEEAEVNYYSDMAKILYDKYRYIQDEFDSSVAKNGVNEEDLSKIVDYVAIICGLVKIDDKNPAFSNDIMEMIIKGANHYNHSICSNIIVLEGELRGYEVNEGNKTEKTDLRFLTSEQQARFKNYKFGSNEIVDKNSDMFLSNLVPMLLAMHGFKVDEGFVKFLVKDLKSKGIEIPGDIKN